MNREETQAVLDTLPLASEKFLAVDAEIIESRPKAVLLATMTGTSEKRTWVPRSQLASLDRGKTFGSVLAIKRSWVAMQKLWWLVN